MAEQQFNPIQERVGITCPASSNDRYNFRLSQVTIENLRNVFGIPSTINFFLIDKDNNIELPTKDGSFITSPKILYKVKFSTPLMIVNDKNASNILKTMIPGEAKGNDDVQDIKIDWDQSHLLDLSKGAGGSAGQTVYTASNGVTVTSSAVTYTNQNFYNIGYLFNGDTTSTAHNSYWLTNSSGDQTLTINFGNWTNLASINIASKTYASAADRRSDYSIDVFEKDGNKWMNICVSLYCCPQSTSCALRMFVAEFKNFIAEFYRN